MIIIFGDVRVKKIKWEVIITIIISVTGLFISWKVNEITKLQGEIAKNTSLPNFMIDERNEIDEKTGRIIDTIIEISNLEGKLNNYNSEIITILRCQYFDENGNFYRAGIPIRSYYIIKNRSGANIGKIESPRTGLNYSKIEVLKNDIENFNKNLRRDSLLVFLKSYIKISYVNLLNEQEILYYETDVFETNLIDENEGKKWFEIYEQLDKLDLEINLNTFEKIDIQQLVDNIIKADELNCGYNEYMYEKLNEMENINDMLETLIGVILGAIFTFATEYYIKYKEKKESEKYAASLLYYDLLSIEEYFKYDKISVNLRYSNEWQGMVSNCNFLDKNSVKYIYDIYDSVYNYNDFYTRNENEIQMNSENKEYDYYKKLKFLFFNDKGEYETKYKVIIKNIEDRI